MAEDLIDASIKVPEIKVRTVTILQDDSQRTICVAGVIRNIGYVDVKGPFKVAIGITQWTTQTPPVPGFPRRMLSGELTVTVPDTVTIAKGGEYTTECYKFPLAYRDEDPNATYDLEVLADVTNVIHEWDDWGNNDLKITWWSIKPAR